MDFIDDFIQEYKNNPCLWKADSIHFKNRSKRQEAYMKLIAVAGKHGEHYNVERTKQKINNLRCAFRHQLKKYDEIKNKGENDEPYCPKRKYFESLMFLKDEESLDKKNKNAKESIEKSNKTATILSVENITPGEFIDIPKTPTKEKVICSPVDNPPEVDKVLKIHETRQESRIKREIFKKENESSEEKTGTTTETTHNNNAVNDSIETFGFGKESPERHKRKSCRKRSSSNSSHISNESEIANSKSQKFDCTSMDFEKLFSLTCKNIQNHMDDHFTNFGKIIAHKLRTMDATQAIYAEKLIADVLFQGQMKLLTALNINRFSSIDPSLYPENNSNK
ncbi:uncharacterized protein LOC119684895 [Teleopsis dalmanni]|uniref:uncharacterized protein LOC119684895 n=1 Tax=Teleopsis dalmanni TaxID=139649 RepID=UPI0018CEA37E|nr:uncharacterized protein LOC119684895 [Teleopsis dalmanni]